MTSVNEKHLLDYIHFSGILLCNVNPYLPSLDDVGAAWADVVALMEKREIFYSKAYRRRTTYLSRQAYLLLKQCKHRLPLDGYSLEIYRFLQQNGPNDMKTIKSSVLLDKKEFTKAFDRLLENLYVTVIRNGETLNETWSTFVWGPAAVWENGIGCAAMPPDEAETQLRSLLGGTMPEKEMDRLIGRTGQIAAL